MSFWDIVWFIVISFCFFAYLMIMFRIIVDLFRDKDTSGVVKALWIVALIFVPFLTALVYLIARGSGMAERAEAEYQSLRSAQDARIREVAGSNGASAADQIARGKELLDAGVISQGEFDALKAKALA